MNDKGYNSEENIIVGGHFLTVFKPQPPTFPRDRAIGEIQTDFKLHDIWLNVNCWW